MSEDLIYAVDFGTSNSLLAAVRGSKVIDPIPLDPKHYDPSIFRSLLYFSSSGPTSYGQEAISQYIEENGDGRFIRSIKKYLPATNFSGTQIGNKIYSLEEIIGSFLREMKRRADNHFDSDVKKVVMGRPAKFSDNAQCDELAQNRLKNAALEAGFEKIEFFPEPLAAAYEYRKEILKEKILLVVDLGGGTSDFTVIRVHPGKFKTEDVLSLGGISIAGDILDGQIMAEKIAPHLGSEIQYKLPLGNNILSMPFTLKAKLSTPAEITLMSRSDIMIFLSQVRKCTLNSDDEIKISQLFELISKNLGFSIFEQIELTKRTVCEKYFFKFSFIEDNIDIEEELTYKEFEALCERSFYSIFNTLDSVISSAQLKPNQIDLICCTGGTSKVPAISKGLEDRFGKEKVKSFKNFHSVIQGLAERACLVYK